MPRGTAFTDSEKGKIIALKDWMFRAVIQNFLKDPAAYGSTKRTGRKRSLNKGKLCEAQVIRKCHYQACDLSMD